MPMPIPEQRQIDRVGQRFVAGISWMYMVSAIVKREHTRRSIRVAQHRIEIDHSVVFATRANPIVDRLSLCFIRRREERERGSWDHETLKRSQSRALDFESSRMCALDE